MQADGELKSVGQRVARLNGPDIVDGKDSVRRRYPATRHVIRPHSAQPARSRAHSEDRYVPSQRAARGGGRGVRPGCAGPVDFRM